MEKDGSRLDGLRRLGPEDYTVSAWSGGSTTQIAIAPAGASYGDRDFLWRVSSATVERAESDFTPLPDYERLIATLEGEICLRHNGGAPLRLKPYEVHAFSGGDATHSSGCCRDFNLMLRRGAASGRMEALAPAGGETVLPGPAGETLLLYCAAGVCAAAWGDRRETLRAGESLLGAPKGPLVLKAESGETRLMLCRMAARCENL